MRTSKRLTENLLKLELRKCQEKVPETQGNEYQLKTKQDLT